MSNPTFSEGGDRMERTALVGGRSVAETTALLRRTTTYDGTMTAADKRWLRARQYDLIILWVELFLSLTCFALTIMNMIFMFIGLAFAVLAAIWVICFEWITGFYHSGSGAAGHSRQARDRIEQTRFRHPS